MAPNILTPCIKEKYAHSKVCLSCVDRFICDEYKEFKRVEGEYWKN